MWEGQREGGTESQAGSTLDRAEPDVELELTNCETMTWAETKSWTLNQLSHPDAPGIVLYVIVKNFQLSETIFMYAYYIKLGNCFLIYVIQIFYILSEFFVPICIKY